MRNWLVTGAQGFIGRFVTASILETEQVHILGIGRSQRLPDSFSHSISGPTGPIAAPLPVDLYHLLDNDKYRYRQTDILDSARVASLLEELRPDVIIHLSSGLRGDSREPLFTTNVEGTARLLEAVGKVKNYQPAVVLGSSGGVYGNVSSDQLPISETTPCIPACEYSVSKLTAELLAQLLARRFGFSLRIARIFNAIGPGQSERHVAGHIAAEIKRAQASHQSVHLGSLTCTRDFIDVRDAASALVLLAGDKVPNGIYNVASGEETSIHRLLEMFLQTSKSHPDVDQGEPRSFDIQRHFADTRNVTNLGFLRRFTLSESVSAIWNYYESCWGRHSS